MSKAPHQGKRARENSVALTESDRDFRLLVESVVDYAIFILDPYGYVVSWNAGAARIKGYSSDQIVGEHFSVFYTEEDRRRDRPSETLRLAEREGRYAEERWRVRKDGRRFWASVTITPLRDEAGALTGFATVTRDLTERMLAEEARREFAARFLAVAENATEAIVTIDTEDRIHFANGGAEKIFGYTVEEMLRLPFSALIPERMRERHRAGLERYAATRTRNIPWNGIELPGLTKDGREVPLEVTFSEYEREDRLYFSGVMRDITDRKHAENRERELLQERARREAAEASERTARFMLQMGRALASTLDPAVTLEVLLEQTVPALAELGIVYLRSDGDAILPAAMRHADPDAHGRVQLLRQHPLDPFGGTAVARVIRTGEPELIAGGTGTCVDDLADREPGRELLRALGAASCMVVPLKSGAQVLGALAFVSTNPDRRYGVDLLLARQVADRAAIEIENARLFGEVRRLSKAKSDFIALMSHDFRTPLAVILMYAEMLAAGRSDPLTRNQRDLVDTIHSSALTLVDLAEEILAFCRVEAGGEVVRIEEISATETAQRVAAIGRPLAERSGLVFRLELPAEEVRIASDPVKLVQILVNLVGNAVNYTNEGEVSLSLTAEKESVWFRVRDTGVGIAPEHLKQIWEPYWQVSAGKGGSKGTGLGLSTTRKLTRLLDGEVSVESTPGRGSTFTVRLPRRVR